VVQFGAAMMDSVHSQFGAAMMDSIRSQFGAVCFIPSEEGSLKFRPIEKKLNRQ